MRRRMFCSICGAVHYRNKLHRTQESAIENNLHGYLLHHSRRKKFRQINFEGHKTHINCLMAASCGMYL